MRKIDVVHAIIRRQNRFLLGKRSLSKKSGPGYWALIGGCVEDNECLQDGLIRECLEEIGTQVGLHKKIAETEEREAIHHWFEVQIVLGEPFLANDENSDLKWSTLSEMLELSPITSEDLKILQSHY